MSFFFFKQKTAYEMRISDWSSDVCSSDLAQRAASSDGYDPESVILTLLSKMRRAQATRSDSRLLARCYVRAAYATPCLSIPLYDDTKSLLNCRLFCVSY